MSGPNTVIELQQLAWRRPQPDAPSDELAGWFAKLAEVHEHLAAEDPISAESERAYAERARAHAADLLGTPA